MRTLRFPAGIIFLLYLLSVAFADDLVVKKGAEDSNHQFVDEHQTVDQIRTDLKEDIDFVPRAKVDNPDTKEQAKSEIPLESHQQKVRPSSDETVRGNDQEAEKEGTKKSVEKVEEERTPEPDRFEEATPSDDEIHSSNSQAASSRTMANKADGTPDIETPRERELSRLYADLQHEHEITLDEIHHVRHQLDVARKKTLKVKAELKETLDHLEHVEYDTSEKIGSLKSDLDSCERELTSKHETSDATFEELKLRLIEQEKHSQARILELAKEPGYCTFPPPEVLPSTTAFEKKSNDVLKDRVDEEDGGDTIMPNQTPISGPRSTQLSYFSRDFCAALILASYNNAFSPVISSTSIVLSAVNRAFQTVISNAASHIGFHWEVNVVPKYKIHLEAHVNKAADSIQVTYDSYLKNNVGRYTEPVGTFVWDKGNRVAYNIYYFFEGEGFWTRAAGLPNTLFSILFEAFMSVVSRVESLPGVKPALGSHTQTFGIGLVSTVLAVLIIVLRKKFLGISAAALFLVLSPFLLVVFVSSKTSRFLSSMIFGKKAKVMKKIDITRNHSNGSNYAESPGNHYTGNANYAESPGNQYTSNVNYAEPPGNQYTNTVTPMPRHMNSSDQWARDRDEPQRSYSINSSLSAQDQRQSPAMVPSIRPVMSTDLSMSRYHSQDMSSDNTHGVPMFSPPLPSGVRQSKSMNCQDEDDGRNIRLSPEGQRHGSMMTSGPPVISPDAWQGQGKGSAGIAAAQYNSAPQSYNTNNANNQGWGQAPVQAGSQNPYPNYGYQNGQKSYEDNA